MKRVTLAAAMATASLGALASTPAQAAVLVADGITYNLTLNSLTNGNKTANFTLAISGINVVGTDTELGRTGINAFAFNDPAVGTATGGSSSGFTWQVGGLSNGCNGTGNFYCFANSGYVLPALGAGGTTSIDFSVTADNAGSWTDWGTTDFKIDWTGSKNNYDLVSLAIPLNRAPVPEPATWALMLVGFGGIGMAMRRRRRQNALMQIA